MKNGTARQTALADMIAMQQNSKAHNENETQIDPQFIATGEDVVLLPTTFALLQTFDGEEMPFVKKVSHYQRTDEDAIFHSVIDNYSYVN